MRKVTKLMGGKSSLSVEQVTGVLNVLVSSASGPPLPASVENQVRQKKALCKPQAEVHLVRGQPDSDPRLGASLPVTLPRAPGARTPPTETAFLGQADRLEVWGPPSRRTVESVRRLR